MDDVTHEGAAGAEAADIRAVAAPVAEILAMLMATFGTTSAPKGSRSGLRALAA